MLDLSQQAANEIYGWANVALIAGATLVLGGTIAAIWTSGVRERYADQRISKNEADTAAANAQAASATAEAAHANENAAKANEAAERERIARLQLEASLADRVITPEQQANLINSLRPYRGQTVDVVVYGDSQEITNFSNVIIASLNRAEIAMNAKQLSGGGGDVRGVLVSIKPGTPPNVAQLAYVFVDAMKPSIPQGVRIWDFEKLPRVVGMAKYISGSPAIASAPIQIYIGSK